jgi:GNAT superfamily N-acetyltransferase
MFTGALEGGIALLIALAGGFVLFGQIKENAKRNEEDIRAIKVMIERYQQAMHDLLEKSMVDMKTVDCTEIYMEEMIGDPVYDVVYERNRLVEDRLNVSIAIAVGGAWDQYDQTIGEIRASISAADGAYDAISGWSARIPALSLEGLFLDLNSIPHFNPEQPWWNRSVIEELQIDGKLYFATGDIVISHLKPMSVYAFNQKLVLDHGIENLYNVVNEHRWTIDYVNSLISDVYEDLNGNGERDTDDRYGLICSSINDADGYMQGFRVSMVSRDEDGMPFLDVDVQRMTTIVEKVYALMWENAGCYATTNDSTDMKAFASDHSLLVTTRIGDVMWQLSEMENDYGLLPYPLLDETQNKYGTRVQDSMNLLSVPIDARNPELSGAVLEALAAQSYRTVTPAYFDVALKNRYSRDEQTAEMMDLIQNSAIINFEQLYNESIGNPWFVLRTLMPAQNSNYAFFPVLMDRVCGVVTVKKDAAFPADHGLMTGMFVADDLRNKGYTEQAFGEAIDVLRRRGCRYLVVENKADPHFQLLIGRFIFEPMPDHEGYMRMRVTVPGVEGPVYG